MIRRILKVHAACQPRRNIPNTYESSMRKLCSVYQQFDAKVVIKYCCMQNIKFLLLNLKQVITPTSSCGNGCLDVFLSFAGDSDSNGIGWTTKHFHLYLQHNLYWLCSWYAWSSYSDHIYIPYMRLCIQVSHSIISIMCHTQCDVLYTHVV